jgi:hypothetical protein
MRMNRISLPTFDLPQDLPLERRYGNGTTAGRNDVSRRLELRYTQSIVIKGFSRNSASDRIDLLEIRDEDYMRIALSEGCNDKSMVEARSYPAQPG